MKNTDPTSHYLLYVARKDRLAAKRDAFVRVVAGLIAPSVSCRIPRTPTRSRRSRP